MKVTPDIFLAAHPSQILQLLLTPKRLKEARSCALERGRRELVKNLHSRENSTGTEVLEDPLRESGVWRQRQGSALSVERRCE
ncbi:hypothetical protein E2C01_036091 [Portunus trituberculatus]|uniref:Uncharacterized protein n=1 Tax=Portunus trituberculatus TaxID=210409 RepID=A0A5B7FB32_PORTR|nr:hypothetical protein [Portunus trituberculatus]